MKVFKIECEWDMGFKELYASREEAEQDIKDTDWVDLLEDGYTLENLMKAGYVRIKEIEV